MPITFPKVSVSEKLCGSEKCSSEHIHYLLDGVDKPLYIALGSLDNPVRLISEKKRVIEDLLIEFSKTENNSALAILLHIIDSMQRIQNERWKRNSEDYFDLIELADDKSRIGIRILQTSNIRAQVGYAGLILLTVNTLMSIGVNYIHDIGMCRTIRSPFQIIEFEETQKITSDGLLPIRLSYQKLIKRVELIETKAERLETAVLSLRDTLATREEIFQ